MTAPEAKRNRIAPADRLAFPIGQRLKRLWQPARPLFWLMVLFNLLSSALAAWLQAIDGPPALRWLLALLALGNAGFGLLCALRLVQPPDPQ